MGHNNSKKSVSEYRARRATPDDPQIARQIDNDRALRDAMGTITDFAHATREQLLAACDTVERLSHSPSLLNRARTMRQLAKIEPEGSPENQTS